MKLRQKKRSEEERKIMEDKRRGEKRRENIRIHQGREVKRRQDGREKHRRLKV